MSSSARPSSKCLFGGGVEVLPGSLWQRRCGRAWSRVACTDGSSAGVGVVRDEQTRKASLWEVDEIIADIEGHLGEAEASMGELVTHIREVERIRRRFKRSMRQGQDFVLTARSAESIQGLMGFLAR
jgi:hypothetical protein